MQKSNAEYLNIFKGRVNDSIEKGSFDLDLEIEHTENKYKSAAVLHMFELVDLYESYLSFLRVKKLCLTISNN